MQEHIQISLQGSKDDLRDLSLWMQKFDVGSDFSPEGIHSIRGLSGEEVTSAVISLSLTELLAFTHAITEWLGRRQGRIELRLENHTIQVGSETGSKELLEVLEPILKRRESESISSSSSSIVVSGRKKDRF